MGKNASLKTGDEKLTFKEENTSYTLLDFWKWSVSDILGNATRGRLAEFIVGTALNLNFKNLRIEWDAFDLETEDGIKIEVKSAAYIQSWEQKNGHSNIQFSIKPAKPDISSNLSTSECKRHADVYVFCLLKHKEENTINPLKMEQWDFFVIPTKEFDTNRKEQQTISLKPLQNLTESVSYDKLKSEIYAKYELQKSL